MLTDQNSVRLSHGLATMGNLRSRHVLIDRNPKKALPNSPKYSYLRLPFSTWHTNLHTKQDHTHIFSTLLDIFEDEFTAELLDQGLVFLNTFESTCTWRPPTISTGGKHAVIGNLPPSLLRLVHLVTMATKVVYTLLSAHHNILWICTNARPWYI